LTPKLTLAKFLKFLYSIIYVQGEYKMSTATLTHLIQQTESLTIDEQLRLAAHLVERARKVYPTTALRRKWREIFGIVPYPLVGEDAQAWSQTRRQADEQREQQWQGKP
jgi:hypothetical protein